MPKDTYYFSHDYNARNDRKIAALVRDFKSSGYGIFWCTVEMLHEEGGILPFDEITFAAIAKDLNEDVAKIEAVLQACEARYGLLQCASNVLRSGRVQKNISELKQTRSKKSEAGRKGGINSGLSRRSEKKTKQNEAVLQANEAVLEADEAKERKGKEINTEYRESATHPDLETVKRVFAQQGGVSEMAEQFFNTYTSIGWILKGQPIKSFSPLVPNYIRNWHEIKNRNKNKKIEVTETEVLKQMGL